MYVCIISSVLANAMINISIEHKIFLVYDYTQKNPYIYRIMYFPYSDDYNETIYIFFKLNQEE